MKCFFGCDSTNQQVKGENFEQFTVKMLRNMSKMLRDLIFVLFGKFAYKYGLSKTIRESREDTTIFLKIVEEIRKRRY
jgi:uracil DNA glycosylase